MKNGAKKILNEIDKFDNIKSRRIIKSFENKIKSMHTHEYVSNDSTCSSLGSSPRKIRDRI